MSQRTRMPNIPVKHTPVRKVVNFTRPLEARLHAYIVYYVAQQGLDPKQAPSEADTIVALVQSFIDHDAGFNRHMRDKATSPEKKKAAPSTPRINGDSV